MAWRWAVVVAAAALAAGCGRPAHPPQRPTKPVVDPPALWAAQVVDEKGRVQAEVRICADERIQQGFSRPLPVSDGQTCGPVTPWTETPQSVAVTCTLKGRPLKVVALRRGDLQRAFTVDVEIQPLDTATPVFSQLRRYVKLGPCPEGWGVGHTMASGEPAPVAGQAGRASNPRMTR